MTHIPHEILKSLFAVCSFAPAAANAQRLWSVGEVTRAPMRIVRPTCRARPLSGAGRWALRAAGLLAALLLALPAVARAEDRGCLENSFTSCLQHGRFQIRASAINQSGARAQAKVRHALVGDAASLFYFFTFDNPELMVKVVDGCALNGRYWVFGSAATDLNYSVTVKDLAAGREETYRRSRSNPLIGDAVSFPCRIPEGVAAGAFGKEAAAGAAGFHGESSPVDDGSLGPDLPLCGGAVVPGGLPGLATEASRAAIGPVALRRASLDRDHVIDIAFVYAGSIIDTRRLRANVDTAVATANIIFRRSAVPAALRTVAVQPDRRYGISLEDEDLDSAIRKVRSILSKVRSDYGADLVYALIAGNIRGFCGLASLRHPGVSPEIAAGFAVGAIWNGTDNDGCLGVNRVLAHEVGHNLGLLHEVEDDVLTPFHPQGHGYKNENVNGTLYNTVMGTVRGTGGGFTRFSTESAYHDGLPMGDELANASEALLYTIEDASNYARAKVPDPVPDHECTAGPTRSCMQKGRFLVEARVSYVDGAGTRVHDAPARVEEVGLGDTASLFHFFDRSNPELLIKVLDGCGVNGKYWVFGSAATDLDWSVLVTDNAIGVTLPYHRDSTNPLINDAAAFSCWP